VRKTKIEIYEKDMKFHTLAKSFSTSESGAASIDWVVLAGAIVGLGIAVLLVL